MPQLRPPNMPRNDGVDREQCFQFLKLLDPTARAFTYQNFREKGDPNPQIVPKVITHKSITALKIEHAAGAGVYVCINETDGNGRKSEDITRIRAVWQEDDDGYSGEFPLPPSIVVETSPRHFHRYWLVADHWPADEQGRADFAAIMERMVTSYGSDNNAKDICRVMRLPGFQNRKVNNGSAQRFEVRIIEACGQRYTRQQILAAFPPVPHKIKKPAAESRLPQGGEAERIRVALDHINDVDDRKIWRDVGMALKQHLGEEGRHLWDEWSRRSSKFDPKDQDSTWGSFRRDDINIGTLFHYAKERRWKSEHHTTQAGGDIHKGKEKNGANGSGKRLVVHDADTIEPEPVKWLWPGRIAIGKTTLIGGDPGLGKSQLSIFIASTITAGGQWPCNEGTAPSGSAIMLSAWRRPVPPLWWWRRDDYGGVHGLGRHPYRPNNQPADALSQVWRNYSSRNQADRGALNHGGEPARPGASRLSGALAREVTR
jgi:hypothetical protein